MTKKYKNLVFEEGLKDLETLVESLENDQLGLDKAFATFEEGVKLSKILSEKLNEVESKINILIKNNDGSIIEKPTELVNLQDKNDEKN